jgi:serine/threonine-protein kinase HipA
VSLPVRVHEQPAGKLDRSDIEDGSFLFTYSSANAPAVSLTMPVRVDPYDAMNSVHPIFEMNLPEGALGERLKRRFAKVVTGFDDLELLRIVGGSVLGRLQFADISHLPKDSLRKLLAYAGAEDLFEALFERYAEFSGVSGMQPKLLFRDESPLDHVSHRSATHIVKSFDPNEFPELAMNEFFAMEASRAAGLPTPTIALAKSRRMLAVERFDVAPEGFLGLEDFCVLSGLRAHGRYEGSYERVAKKITTFVSPAHRIQGLEQLFAMLVLASAVENGDMHLKNFAVLYDDMDSNVRLAPVYDFVTTTVYHSDVLALTLNDEKGFPTRRALEHFARTACNLSKARATTILTRIAEGVGKSLRRLKKYQHAPKVKKRLIEAYERGLKRIQ